MPNSFPKSFTPLRWGILGAGAIAKRFCSDVVNLEGHQIAAVGSRDQAKADAFADQFSAPRRHAGYEALVADSDVDCVYVATPHNFHKEHSLLALAAGKPVLCEKPFTINADEAQTIIAHARAQNLFLMEGMWSRCFPLMGRVRELVAAGEIGEVRMVTCDFGFRAGNVNPEARLFNPNLGGGGLMDVGVYTVSFASMILGTPTRTAALAEIGQTGVDEQAGMLLSYEGGQIAVLSTGVRTNTPHEATVLGTTGRIRLHTSWWKPTAITVTRNGKPDEKIEMPIAGGGFQFEAEHVAQCLRENKTESPIMPLDETLAIMKTLDTLRAQMGVKYPME